MVFKIFLYLLSRLSSFSKHRGLFLLKGINLFVHMCIGVRLWGPEELHVINRKITNNKVNLLVFPCAHSVIFHVAASRLQPGVTTSLLQAETQRSYPKLCLDVPPKLTSLQSNLYFGTFYTLTRWLIGAYISAQRCFELEFTINKELESQDKHPHY